MTRPPLKHPRRVAPEPGSCHGAQYLLLLACTALAVGCSDSPSIVTIDGGRGEDTEAAREGNMAGGTTGSSDGPLYLMRIQVFNPDGRDTYLAATNSLDAPGSAFQLGNAREFPGIAGVNTVGGRVLVSSGDAPVITSFAIDDDLSWHEGETLSFAQYPLDDNANWYTQYVLDEKLVYFPYETYKRIIWDPSEMTISTDLDDTRLELTRDGMLLRSGGNFAQVRYSDKVRQAFYYTDEDWYRFGPSSVIVEYDPVTHEEQKIIQAPCPGLQIGTKGDDGYTYFSTDDYRPGFALYGEGPAPCVVRITPDGELDEDFTTDLTEWTGGKLGVNFQYIGNGRAFANVYDADKSGIDFSAPLDPEVVNNLWESSPAWSLWMLDLEAREAHPIEGIGDLEIGWNAYYAVLDGRSFLLAPYGDGEGTKIFEIDANGIAREHLDVPGSASHWRRIR